MEQVFGFTKTCLGSELRQCRSPYAALADSKPLRAEPDGITPLDAKLDLNALVVGQNVDVPDFPGLHKLTRFNHSFLTMQVH